MHIFLISLLAVVSLCAGAFVGPHFNSVKDQNDMVVRDLDNGRIVGGRTVDIVMYPHQISLRYRDITCTNCIRKHICGGSIISSTMIVTAAHCINGRLPKQFQAVAGANQRKGSDSVIALVKEIIMHEGYNSNTVTNDIALLQLATPLPLNNFTVKAIDLAHSVAKEGEIATITGWGSTGKNRYPDFLQEVKVPIVSNELCNEDYNPKSFISDDMMCAGYRGVGGKDACYMDSGGPLEINGKLAGIVSWGDGCATPKYPGVYARISYFRPWLLEKIAQYQ